MKKLATIVAVRTVGASPAFAQYDHGFRFAITSGPGCTAEVVCEQHQ